MSGEFSSLRKEILPKDDGNDEKKTKGGRGASGSGDSQHPARKAMLRSIGMDQDKFEGSSAKPKSAKLRESSESPSRRDPTLEELKQAMQEPLFDGNESPEATIPKDTRGKGQQPGGQEPPRTEESLEHPKPLSVPEMIHLLRDKEVASRILKLMHETEWKEKQQDQGKRPPRTAKPSDFSKRFVEAMSLEETTVPEYIKGKGLDKGKESHGTSDSKILDNFKQIGGKSKLSDATLIWLLEDHYDEIHHENNIDLIVSIAKSDRGKKGVIVLQDGIPVGEKIDKQEFLTLRINVLSKMFENQEKIADTLWKKSLPFASLDNVRIFGCDDLKLMDDSEKHALNLGKIEHEKEGYDQSRNREKVSELSSRSKLEREELRKIGVQRNITWLNTYSDMREKNSEAIIIGIGGRNHFTEDPNFTEKLENLENESYIALDPMHQLPREEQIKRYNKYYRK